MGNICATQRVNAGHNISDMAYSCEVKAPKELRNPFVFTLMKNYVTA